MLIELHTLVKSIKNLWYVICKKEPHQFISIKLG